MLRFAYSRIEKVCRDVVVGDALQRGVRVKKLNLRRERQRPIRVRNDFLVKVFAAMMLESLQLGHQRLANIRRRPEAEKA